MPTRAHWQAFALVPALWLAAGAAAAERKTVRGEVVDVQCVRKAPGNVGRDHVDCALSCARRGGLMGILASDALYVITGDYTSNSNRKLIELVARVVDATGVVTDNGETKTIRVEEVRPVE